MNTSSWFYIQIHLSVICRLMNWIIHVYTYIVYEMGTCSTVPLKLDIHFVFFSLVFTLFRVDKAFYCCSQGISQILDFLLSVALVVNMNLVIQTWHWEKDKCDGCSYHFPMFLCVDNWPKTSFSIWPYNWDKSLLVLHLNY